MVCEVLSSFIFREPRVPLPPDTFRFSRTSQPAKTETTKETQGNSSHPKDWKRKQRVSDRSYYKQIHSLA